jgi:hypothetical protein
MGKTSIYDSRCADPLIRWIEERDIPKIIEMQGEFAWTFERDFMGALAVVDKNDIPVLVTGAWKRAEVHLLADRNVKLPASAFLELHQAMAEALAKDNVAEVVTWMDDMQSFGRRLKQLGWETAKRTMWVRRLI